MSGSSAQRADYAEGKVAFKEREVPVEAMRTWLKILHEAANTLSEKQSGDAEVPSSSGVGSGRCHLMDASEASPTAATTTTSPSQVHLNYHQDVEAAIKHQVNLQFSTSQVFFTMSYLFDRYSVALKNFAKYFFEQSHEEEQYAKKLQNQCSGQIFLQDMKKPDCDNKNKGLNGMDCALFLEKSVNQSLQELHKLATDKNDPHLCYLIGREMHYMEEQVKAIRELGDHVTNLCNMGAHSSLMMEEHLFDKLTLGTSDNAS